jgi:hypothetical protein
VVNFQGVQGKTWLSREWSPWLDIVQALQRGHGPPHQPGVYRIRDARLSGFLLYVGEGGDIRGRLFQLRNAMEKVAAGGPQGPPHWAGACILYHQQQGARIEVSWLLQTVEDEGDRKGIECECIAAHRWATGSNPECQFIALTRRKTTEKR